MGNYSKVSRNIIKYQGKTRHTLFVSREIVERFVRRTRLFKMQLTLETKLKESGKMKIN